MIHNSHDPAELNWKWMNSIHFLNTIDRLSDNFLEKKHFKVFPKKPKGSAKKYNPKSASTQPVKLKLTSICKIRARHFLLTSLVRLE